jgi:DNA-binding ferritin-like protein
MEDLIKEIQQKTGLSTEKVVEVVTIVTDFLKDALPEELIDQIATYLGDASERATEVAGAATSTASGAAAAATSVAVDAVGKVVDVAASVISKTVGDSDSAATSSDDA